MASLKSYFSAAVFSGMMILSCAPKAWAEGEVNVYSYRQPELIQPLLDAGRLVALSENEAPSPFGYDLICPQENRSRPRFRAFSEWLAEECA